MNHKNRRRFEIIADILRTARRGSLKTRIMYTANLNWGMLLKYLEQCEARGVLRGTRDGGRWQYSTTMKGERVLEEYAEFRKYEAYAAEKRDRILELLHD